MREEYAYIKHDLSCWAMPICDECGRRKKPRGRDSMDNGLCDSDCPGYRRIPKSGHLWPGEIADDGTTEGMCRDGSGGAVQGARTSRGVG